MKTLPDAVREFLDASREEWGSSRAEKAMNRLQQLAPKATQAELDTAAGLVAATLGEWPQPERGRAAITLGILVESGAAAGPNAGPLLEVARATVGPTLEFAAALSEAMPDEPEAEHDEDEDDDAEEHEHEHGEDCDHDHDDPDDPRQAAFVAISSRMPEQADAAHAFAPMALATIACLARCPEGRALARQDARLLEQARTLANLSESPPNANFLSMMLHVLDGERLLVLHPGSGRGFEVVITGVADNFQLHTLLAAALVPLGLPGVAPSRGVVACARGEGPQESGLDAQGVFNLHHWTALGPDGSLLPDAPQETWIWNEGVPADVRAFEGRRVIVLGPPPYERGWPAARLFDAMRASLEVERELEPGEARNWASRLGGAPRPADPLVMHGGP